MNRWPPGGTPSATTPRAGRRSGCETGNTVLLVHDAPRGQALDARERRKQAFLDRYSLRPSKARLSVGKVAGKRLCPHERFERYGLWQEKRYYPKALGWFDHTDLFYGPSGYVLTTQPYDLTDEKLAALECLCFEAGIAATVSVCAGWHYPGRCPLVVLHKKTLEVKP